MAQTTPKAKSDETKTDTQVVSFAFLKGGATKTTLAVNTARHLAERNEDGRTLLIDFDPSGHATKNIDYGHGNLYKSDSDIDKVLLGEKAEVPPESLTVSTDFGFDILPSTNELEGVGSNLAKEMRSSARLRFRVVEPLLGDHYDYILIDQPSAPGVMNNNGSLASESLICPLVPAAETIESFAWTRERLVEPLENMNRNVDILALVPNLLESRIDQQTLDRELLEAINTDPVLKHYVPDFARITEEEWEMIDNGEMKPPKPGIRSRDAISKGMKDKGLPLLDYDPDNDQNKHFDELAQIIEQGGVR